MPKGRVEGGDTEWIGIKAMTDDIRGLGRRMTSNLPLLH